ncbi:MAG: hypothetical protein WCY37_01800 [Candidatus Dojkabacteria bacterium]
MTVGKIVVTAVGGLILALITGLITRNIIVAILFPILLIGFLLMWRRIKEETPPKPQKEDDGKVIAVKKQVEVKVKEDQSENQPQPTPQVDNYQQPMQNQSQPPVSTNYPPRQSLR